MLGPRSDSHAWIGIFLSRKVSSRKLERHQQRTARQIFNLVLFLVRRCVVFLLLPQFFSKRGRQALMAYAFISTLTGPAKNTLHNISVLSESLVCGQVSFCAHAAVLLTHVHSIRIWNLVVESIEFPSSLREVKCCLYIYMHLSSAKCPRMGFSLI